VDVLWLVEGQTEDQALDAHISGYVCVDEDGASVEPGSRGEPPQPSSSWSARIRAAEQALRAAAPDLEAVELEEQHEQVSRLVCVDDLGLVVVLRPGSATVEPGATGLRWDFDRAWQYLQVLADLGPAVVYEPDDDAVVDIDLPVERAREWYRW
jgi:hypothetical protein